MRRFEEVRAQARALLRRDRARIAVYAAVLDGTCLWLALEGGTERVSLALMTDDGQRLPLTPESTRSLPGGSGVELLIPLHGLPVPAGHHQRSESRVVIVDDDGRVTPILAPSEPLLHPMQVPAVTQGWLRHDLGADQRGHLLLARTGLRPWRDVHELGVDERRGELTAVIRLSGDVEGAHSFKLVPLGKRKESDPVDLPSEPLGADRALLRVPSVVSREVRGRNQVMVQLAGQHDLVPARRRHNALVSPDDATVLPALRHAYLPRPVLRWQYSSDGTLLLVAPAHRPVAKSG